MISEGKNRKYGKRKYDRIRNNVDFGSMGPQAVLFGEYIKMPEAQKRIGTSEAYFACLLSLLRFKPCLRLEEITAEFLYAYEQWFLENCGGETTVGIHLRGLRCILNIQKSEGQLTEKEYPFGLRKYLIPAVANIKIALELPELKTLWNYQYHINDERELFYLARWFFGFFANGINPKDIIHLQYGNFEGDFIILQRQKTRRTTRSKPRKIVIPVNAPMKRIIKRFGNPDTSPENYVFNILKSGLSPHRQRELNQDFTCIINGWMKKIAANPLVNIRKKITTNVWRHSFATLLKRSGVSTEFIIEALGHHNLETTENNLADFDLDFKREIGTKLLTFIGQPALGTSAGF